MQLPLISVLLVKRMMTLSHRLRALTVSLANTALKDPLVQLPLIFVLLGQRMMTLSHRQCASSASLANTVLMDL